MSKVITLKELFIYYNCDISKLHKRAQADMKEVLDIGCALRRGIANTPTEYTTAHEFNPLPMLGEEVLTLIEELGSMASVRLSPGLTAALNKAVNSLGEQFAKKHGIKLKCADFAYGDFAGTCAIFGPLTKRSKRIPKFLQQADPDGDWD